MAKGRVVWLARDHEYSIHIKKPKWLEERGTLGFWGTDNEVANMRRGYFERITDYKLEPGECKRVRIQVEEQ